jgi:hypothetical protein
MLTIKLKDGGEADIPFGSVLMLEERSDKSATIVYNLDGQQNQMDETADNYGFLKKKLTDNLSIIKPIEVTNKKEDKELRLLISEDYIMARRDITDKENPHKTRVTLNVRGAIFPLDIMQTRAKLDGAD